MNKQYPNNVEGFTGPFNDQNRPGMYIYINQKTGEYVDADGLMRALQQRHQQQPQPPAGGGHWLVTPPGQGHVGATSGGSMSNARDILRGDAPPAAADPFRGSPEPQAHRDTVQQPIRPTDIQPHQLKGNQMTALYASGRLRPHRQIAYYPTTHSPALLTDYQGNQAEYVIERRKDVDINDHLVIDAAAAVSVDNDRRLTGGGALMRRRCPDSYPLLKNVIESNSMAEAMNAARVYSMVCNDINTIMPSLVRTTICTLPLDIVDPEHRFADLNFMDMSDHADIRNVASRIENGMGVLERMGLSYAYRWFNSVLLDLINHVLRFELRAPVQLVDDVRREIGELVDWMSTEEGLEYAEDLTKQLSYLLRMTLGLEVDEMFSSVDGKEDQPVKVLTRISRPPIVTVANDPEVLDSRESNTEISPLTDGQVLEQLSPAFYKMAEEAVVNIRHEYPNQDNYHFILNVMSGNGFEIYAMRRKASGWNFWTKRVIER